MRKHTGRVTTSQVAVSHNCRRRFEVTGRVEVLAAPRAWPAAFPRGRARDYLGNL